jgi:flagellin
MGNDLSGDTPLTLKVNTHRTALRALGRSQRNEPRGQGLQEEHDEPENEQRRENDLSQHPQTEPNTDTSFVGQSPTFRLATKNALTGIGTIETAEGATHEVRTLLNRGRELAHQSTQEVLSSRERSFLQDEFLELRKSVVQIAQSARFEGIPLADGTMTALELHVGIGNTTRDRMTLELGDLTATALGFFPVGAPPIGLGNTTAAHTAIAVIDLALQSVSRFRSDFSRVQRRIESALGTLHGYTRGLHGVQEIVEDAYHAQVVAQSTRVMMVHHPAMAAQAQASQMHRSMLRLV